MPFQSTIFDAIEAQRQRDEVLTATDAANWTWSEWAKDQVLRHLRNHDTVTADDLRAACERANVHPTDNRAFGAALRALVQAGEIMPVGYTESKVKSSHARPIRVFAKAPGE